MKLRRRERGWRTHRVHREPSDAGIVAAAQAIIGWDLGRPEHERGSGLTITDSIEIAELAVAGWLVHHPTLRHDPCGCPCHQVVRPGLVPCPRCGVGK